MWVARRPVQQQTIQTCGLTL